MGSERGWIKLHRSVMEGPDWLAEPFTRAQAWIDLLLLANHSTGSVRRRGILVAVERGSVGYSEEALAARWRWSKGKVRRFLSELTKLSQISRRISEKTVPKNTSVSSLIYIVNYDKYQGDGTEAGTENGPKTVLEQECKEGEEKKLSKPGLPLFDQFYDAYPVHKGKTATIKAFSKIKPQDFETILARLEAQKAQWNRMKAAGQWVPEWPYPATWLNKRRWEDEVQTEESADETTMSPIEAYKKREGLA